MTFDEQRHRMVREQLETRGISDERVLSACRTVPRHLFMAESVRQEAYADHPVTIGHGQTMSQPYIVALMLQVLRLRGHERALEIGTGSGYQTALLAELVLEVYSVERLPELTANAGRLLNQFGYLNVHLRTSNGTLGWPEQAPYDAIIVSAAAHRIPPPLLEQLAPTGRLVMPVGPADAQTLTLVEKRDSTLRQTAITSCVFVPLLGEYGWTDRF